MVEPWFPVDFPLNQPNERLGSKPAKIARCSACRVGRAWDNSRVFKWDPNESLDNYGNYGRTTGSLWDNNGSMMIIR